MSWTAFLGRFHPVLVHLPIGFLMIAIMLELARWWGRTIVSSAGIRFILFWSAVSATMACGAGYLLSLGGGYDEHLLDEHQWQGIWLAALTWMAWVLKNEVLQEKIKQSRWLYAPVLGLGAVLLMVAGHHGGALTHGETYLTSETPEPLRGWLGIAPKSNEDAATTTLDDLTTNTAPPKPIDINNALAYQDVVQPVLKLKCMPCHNANKMKGGLRMDQIELLSKGGKHGKIFVAGKSAESEMLKRCLLPLDNDEHMPPKGKTQLTQSETELIAWWIDQGASFDKKVTDLSPTDNIKAALGGLAVSAIATTVVVSPVLGMRLPAPDAKAIETLRNEQILVVPLSNETPNLLEINAVNAHTFDDTKVALLQALNKNLVWLKIGNTNAGDGTLASLKNHPNLVKIHLENTKITDAGLKHLASLSHLEYLNIVGTNITDTGLSSLANCKNLREIYVWQTKITAEGIAALQQKLPTLKIIGGVTEAEVAEFVKLGENAPKPLEVPKKP